jgi:hypothetical protein
MNNKLVDQIKSFQKRWNVTWDDATAFMQFRNRLIFLIDKHLSKSIVLDTELINQYAFLCGLPAPYAGSGRLNEIVASVELQQKGLNTTIIFTSFSYSQAPIHLAWYLQNLFLAIEERLQSRKDRTLEVNFVRFYAELKDLIKISPSSQIRLSKTKKGIIVYPAGAKMLDESLVNDNLAWLQDFPESLNAFEQALSIYLSGDKPKFRNLTDNLRVSIEQLLRRILINQKSLENQSKELDDWLEKHGVHKQVRNLYGQFLFGPYAALQNDVAKHGDVELLPDEIEYLIYLTGTFMRLIIQLRRSEA